MNTKTMEGLVGASTNLHLVNTPMKVYKEARNTGNTAVMERAMGYAGEFAEKAKDCTDKAKVGLQEEAEETREKLRDAIEEKMQEKNAETTSKETQEIAPDTVEISAEGEALLKNNISLDSMDSARTKLDSISNAVTYTKAGMTNQVGQSVEISVSI